MSILNITNLTSNPERLIQDNYNSAFDELEKELNTTIDQIASGRTHIEAINNVLLKAKMI